MNGEETANGLVKLRAKASVDELVKKLEEMLAARGVKIFAVIDHSGEAEKAGLEMPNTKVVIFGNPKAGTPLMLEAPSIAIDLPLKILIAEDGAGGSSVSYNSADYLAKRHGLPAEKSVVLASVAKLAKELVE